MKIVIATTSGFHLRHLARELIAIGRDVTYMTYLPTFRIRRDGIPLTNARSHFVRLQPWSTMALLRYTRWQSYAVEAMFKMTDEAFARDLPPCDVFIGLSAMAVESARIARQKYGAKVIIERGSRHVLSQNELITSSGGSPLTPIYVERELASYQVADYIALPSRHAVESFETKGFDSSRLFRNRYGVDVGAFAPSPQPGEPIRLLYVGGWTFRKGCDLLVTLMHDNPDLCLTHVGTQGDVAFPAAANFKSLGHKTHQELRTVMENHHILLLPSREDGFGMVLTEALCSGLPVVASSMTGAPDLREVISNKNAVAIVRPEDSEALATAIRNVIANIRSRVLTRDLLTREDKGNLSWSAYAKRYDDFIRSIL